MDVEELLTFNQDAFTKWIMAELEWLEETLYTSNLSAAKYIELKSRYDALLEAKNKYFETK